MRKSRNIVSFILMSVYLIILAHNVIPHHHHADLLSESCQLEHQHDPVVADQVFVPEGLPQCHCSHNPEPAGHCSFQVELVPSKVIFLTSCYLLQACVDDLLLPDFVVETYAEPEFLLPKIFCEHPSGLRAPPFSS
ncbi:DUF6769 family protein [Gaoshiqia sediminis]|uniref:Uncharacterized protein n=1 Tax=Gaoshiqia sediminis TaxID=2986998 RepID=A0AA42CB33_9BACT|nr:DUF6769 family protein [Gaoshiqia sediminis]MCW0484682.1 hypothetical protein [Gaoshiqia sediminis]